jgi:hypothetical protein
MSKLDGETTNWMLLKLLHILLFLLQPIADIVQDDGDRVGWSKILDPETCPAAWLRWCGMFYGVSVTPGDPTDPVWEAKARAEVLNAAGMRRGTPGAIVGAVQGTLTGAEAVRLIERVDGNYLRFLVVTRPSETPDVDATRRAIVSQKPGRKVFEFEQDDFPLVDEMSRPINSITPGVAIDDLTLADVT